MADAYTIGAVRAPKTEQPVAALVVSPDEALRGNVRCPSVHCSRTDSLLKKVYESTAYITRAEKTLSIVSPLPVHLNRRTLTPQFLNSSKLLF